MSDIIIFDHSIPSIGYVARTTTAGEELEMVNRYIEYYKKKSRKSTHKKVAIFIEPQIESGYPDIVIIEYYQPQNDMWCDARNKLTTVDLKVLMQIISTKSSYISVDKLSDILGYDVGDITKSAQHLFDSRLVYLSKSKKHVGKVALNKWCRIKRVISIEAKIDKWCDVIGQAERNIWFSTDSYILMNKERCSNNIREMCKEKELGIILVNGNIKTDLKCQHRNYPISYASLQFNEWVQRLLHSGEE